MKFFLRAVFSWLLCVVLAACAGPRFAPDDAPLSLEPATFADLPGWQADSDMGAALSAFGKSCTRILKRPPSDAFGPLGGTYGNWHPACRDLAANPAQDARAFFERHFRPYRAIAGGRWDEGLFTGYYEASLRGSRTRAGAYTVPILKRPADLVMVDLGEFRDTLKGQRIAGRVIDGNLKPYETRAAIEDGKLPDSDNLAIVWVDDPVDAFFLHIQGSGRVLLDDGSSIHVGYAAQNGHPYYAIGRELVKRGIMDKDDVSMQSIRAWLAANPGEARSLMNLNPSYIFFEELPASEGPRGGEGLPLTPGRSLAVDRTKIPYGVPLWVDIKHPAPEKDGENIRRLMVAQDTGGAIKGAIRGDFFWGYGPEAENMAGIMKSPGRYWLLLPRSITN